MTLNAKQKFLDWEDAVKWLLEQPDQAQLVVDCYYDSPLTDAADRYWSSDEWTSVKKRLPKNHGTALDVGAGRGIASYALAKEGFDVTALEPDPSGLVGASAIRNLAAEVGLPIKVVEETSEKLPFGDNEFDLVFARAVLHHTRDLQQACNEFFRVLKPGGILIAIREHVISTEQDLPRFFEIHPLHKLYGGEHAYLLSRYLEAIQRSGLVTREVISPWHSAMNFSPNTLSSLKDELARRASLGVPGIRQLVKLMLAIPGVWEVARILLNRIDNRPGRLYSFIAEKA